MPSAKLARRIKSHIPIYQLSTAYLLQSSEILSCTTDWAALVMPAALLLNCLLMFVAVYVINIHLATNNEVKERVKDDRKDFGAISLTFPFCTHRPRMHLNNFLARASVPPAGPSWTCDRLNDNAHGPHTPSYFLHEAPPPSD